MRCWVHHGYSRDLQTLGIEPVERGGTYDCYDLPESEWEAFVSLYSKDWPPRLFLRDPSAMTDAEYRAALNGMVIEGGK